MRFFNPKLLLTGGIIIGIGYLVSQFPDESVLIIGISMVILIGYWLNDAYKN